MIQFEMKSLYLQKQIYLQNVNAKANGICKNGKIEFGKYSKVEHNFPSVV
jgi:hypothetical protein